MPTIRQRIARAVFREDIDKIGQAYDMLVEGYRQGPAVLSPTTLIANLTELDSQMLDLIMRQRGWEPIIGQGVGGFYELTEADRLREVDRARHEYHFDVQVKRGVKAWTDFGFGQTFAVNLPDPQAQKIWDECATNQRNWPLFKARKIQELSNNLINDGEIFLVAYQSTVTGETTWRRFKTEEIKDVIYADDDQDVALFYVRSEAGENVYYPDYAAPIDALDNYEIPAGAVRADQRNGALDFVGPDQQIMTEPTTKVSVIQAAFEVLNGRGWPVLSVAFPWARAYKHFLQDRATIARAVASMVDLITHKGGSRTQTELMSQIATTLSQTMPWDSNAPPTAGSTGIKNEAVDIERRPLTTGAGDARIDGMTLLGQVAAGDGLALHQRGRADAMQNRATARETERPWLEAMQRYQTFWKDIILDMVRVTLAAAGIDPERALVGAEVFMQSPFVMYPDEAAAAINSVTGAAQAGTLDYSVAQASIEIITGLVLTTYGVSNVRDIFENAKTERQSEPTEAAQAILTVAETALTNFRAGEAEPEQVIEYLYSSLQELL